MVIYYITEYIERRINYMNDEKVITQDVVQKLDVVNKNGRE